MLEIRFTSKYKRTESGCWEWIAGCFADGYAGYSFEGKMVRAHRYSYECLVGPIPDGLVIHHSCRNIKCVNPDHLEAVTNRENLIRGEGPVLIGKFHKSKIQCPKGHMYSPSNTHIAPNGQRVCRECNRLRVARKRAALKNSI